MAEEKSKLVYSTDKAVPRKDKPDRNSQGQRLRTPEQKLIVRIDRRGRGGKSVTIIEGLPLSSEEREKFLKKLKASLGTGGTLKDTSLEIQGDHCDAIIKSLERIGYKPKRSGG